MKKMGNRILVILTAAVVCLATGARADDVIIVYDNSDDQDAYVSFLQGIYGNGVSIEASKGKYNQSLTNALKDELQDADLVIVSRDTNSSDYAADAGFWSTLTTPLLLHSPFLTRSGKWDWVDDNNDPGTYPGQFVDATAAGHQLYDGVSITGGQVQLYQSSISVCLNRNGALGNGTRVADRSGLDDHAVVATWDTSQPYYSISGHTSYIPGEDRILFATSNTADFFNETTGATGDGEQLLENAVLSLYPGSTIVRYTFDADDFIGSEQVTPDSYADNVTASNLTDDLSIPGSNGNITLDAIDRSYPDKPALRATQINASAADTYFEFGITVDPGYELDLTRLTFDASRGGTSTPRSWSLRTSLDGFATTIDSAEVTVDFHSDNMELHVVDLAESSFSNVTGSVTFRIPIDTNGGGKSLEFDNLTLSGTVVYIPEPGTLVLLMTGLAGLLAFAWRRRKNRCSGSRQT